MNDQTQQKIVSLQDPLAVLIAGRWIWKDSTVPVVQRTFGYPHKLALAGADLRKEVDAIRLSDRLTDAGKDDHLAKFIAANFAPVFRTADLEG